MSVKFSFGLINCYLKINKLSVSDEIISSSSSSSFGQLGIKIPISKGGNYIKKAKNTRDLIKLR